jgi:hypothetical protein
MPAPPCMPCVPCLAGSPEDADATFTSNRAEGGPGFMRPLTIRHDIVGRISGSRLNTSNDMGHIRRPITTPVVLVASLIWLAACGSKNPTTPSSTTPPNAPSGPVAITGCGDIENPGAYAVTVNLTQSTSNCLDIFASNVQLDCQNHMVSGIDVNSSNNITITNCLITGSTNSIPLLLLSSENITINNSTIQSTGNNAVGVTGCRNITINNNTISTSYSAASITDAVIWLVGGSQNQILQNTIDGGYPGYVAGISPPPGGTDDGIVLVNETNDVIQANMISNVFDAGIEGVDAVTNTTIANNVITNAAFAGIGAYHCTDWRGNIVQGNLVLNSVLLVDFTHSVDSPCLPPPPAGAFTNNQIVGNQLQNKATWTWSNRATIIDFVNSDQSDQTNVPLSGGSVAANLIQGNNFGSEGVYVNPTAGFTNGGGNICGANGGDLICNGTGFSPPLPLEAMRSSPPGSDRRPVLTSRREAARRAGSGASGIRPRANPKR